MIAFFRTPPMEYSTSDKVPIETESILEDMKKTRCALEVAYSGFDNVTDHDLIDCYIYEVNAILKRYKYLQQKLTRGQEII